MEGEKNLKRGLNTSNFYPSDAMQAGPSKIVVFNEDADKKVINNEVSVRNNSLTLSDIPEENDMTSYDQEPEEVICGTEINGQLNYLLKWKNREEATLLPAFEAHTLCPQVILKFLEDRLKWNVPVKK